MPIGPQNRRQFMAFAGSGAIALAGAGCTSLPAAAVPYDLVIKGGRMIDPAADIDAVLDVAVAGGRIAAIAPNLATGATRVIDAGGKLVLPGLIDIHTHAAVDRRSPGLILVDGVTGWIESGWYGADDIAEPVAALKAAPQVAGILVNMGRKGLAMRVNGEIDISLADVAAARRAIAENRQQVVGVKTHLSQAIIGNNDIEVLRRAQEATEPFGLPVMVHIGDTQATLGELLALMKPGDIVTHTYTSRTNALLDGQGKVVPEAFAARERGILFDWGNGTRGHAAWEVAERAFDQGFLPDTISTDGTMGGYEAGVARMPAVMSNVLALGVSLPQVVAMTTINAARAFPLFAGRGTLRPGAPADIAVMELRSGEFTLVDTSGNERKAGSRLFPSATVLGGEVMVEAG